MSLHKKTFFKLIPYVTQPNLDKEFDSLLTIDTCPTCNKQFATTKRCKLQQINSENCKPIYEFNKITLRYCINKL